MARRHELSWSQCCFLSYDAWKTTQSSTGERHLKSHPSHAVICSEERGISFSRTRRRPLPVSGSVIPLRLVLKASVRTVPQRPCRTRPPILSSPQRQKQSHH